MVMMMMAAILTDAADVMMMADLCLADGILEAGQPHTVFAQLAIHVGTTLHRFLGALGENIEQ